MTHVLVRRPRTPTWSWRGQTHALETSGRREIGDSQIDLPLPDPARHLLVRWNALLGQVAVPLRPSRVLGVSEVESTDDITSLPAVVRRRHSHRWPRRGRFRSMPDPAADDRDSIDLERHALDGAGVLELADQGCNAAVLTAPDQLDRLLVV